MAATLALHLPGTFPTSACLTRWESSFCFVLILVVFIVVVECQFCHCWDILQCKEGQLVDSVIALVVRHGELADIRVARMIDEACRAALVLAVDYVGVVTSREIRIGMIVRHDVLVERIEVGVLLTTFGLLLSSRGLLVSDDFASVSVYELASSKRDLATKS